MTKKIVIVPACTDLNRGDQALVWETAYLLRDAINEDVEIDIVDYGNNYEDRKRQSSQTEQAGFNVIRNITENPKRFLNNKSIHNKFSAFFFAGLVAVFDFIKHLILLAIPTDFVFGLIFKGHDYKETFNCLKGSDSIVIKGGGYLHTYGKLEDLYYLWFGLYYVLLAKRLGKKVIVFPNSIGPITGWANRKFFKYAMGKVDLLFVREKISKSYLDSMGINSSIYAFDLGYYSESLPVKAGMQNIEEKSEKTKIGITLRPYRFPKSDNPDEKYSCYITAVAEYCNKNHSENKFYFIVQVQGPSAHETDLIAIKDVVSKLNSCVNFEIVDDEYNYRELLDIYSKMDYVMGTRFHSVIFAQVMGIPSIAIAYGGNKSRGIMRELGLEKFVVDIEKTTSEKLSEMMTELKNEKADYISKLNENRDVIEKDRENVINHLHKVL